MADEVPRRDPAMAIAHAAMSEMLRHGVSPTPENYQLFFAFFLPGHLPWRAEMEKVLAGDGDLAILHDRVFSPTHGHELVTRVSSELGSTLDEASRAMSAAAADAGNYGRTLDVLTEALSAQGASPPSLISSLVKETRRLRAGGQELTRRLHAMAERARALQAELAAARREAMSDPLTGLSNRRAFDAALASALRGGPPASLLLLDLDHFKAVNDQHGHAAGDRVLEAAAAAVRGVVSAEELAARVGGEEMAIILRRPATSAVMAATQVRQAIASVSVSVPSGCGCTMIRVTASVGATMARPGDTSQSILMRADRLLYAAKRGGRDRVATDISTGAPPAVLTWLAPSR